MRKVFFLLVALFTIITVTPQSVYAQNSKVDRKAIKEKEKDEQIETMMKRIESRNFSYFAKELISIPKASIARIKLSGTYYIEVSGNRLKCYLPIYGTTPNDTRPSLAHNIDFITEDFKMETKRGKGSIIVDIEAKDDRTNTKYYFKLTVPASGFNTILRVSTNLDSPVTFSGEIKK